MKWLLLITSVLISIAVTVTSGKQFEVPSSKLILEYNWPDPKKNLERYPHAKSCSHFYVNKPDGSQTLKKCPENELFDFRTLRCRPKVLAKCWNDLLKKDHSKKVKRRFSCPFPWGLYPDIEDCSTFYDCLSGKPYLRKCPSFTLFDKAERTCVNENEALCADHSDIVEVDYKCPNKWGYFTYSKDCSKFYECLRKVPSLRSCKKNMLFDNLKRNCMPMNNVDCGERFNPYGKNKESTKHASTAEKGTTTGSILETTKLTSTGEVKAGRVSNRGEGMTTKITPTEGVQELTKLTPTSEDVKTGRVSNGGAGMTTKITPARGVQDITKLTPTSEEVKTGRVSNGGDGMTTKITPTRGVQDITKLIPTSEEVKTGRVSNGGDGMTTKITPTRGVQDITKLTPTSEEVKAGRVSNGGDGTTTKITPTGGVQDITKLTPTSEDVTTGRVSNREDTMTIKSTTTGGVQETTKLTSTREEIITGRVSPAGITTRHIPSGGTQEMSKLILTGEDITGHISVEGERDKFEHISAENIKTSGEQLKSEIIPAGRKQKAVDERNSKKEERI